MYVRALLKIKRAEESIVDYWFLNQLWVGKFQKIILGSKFSYIVDSCQVGCLESMDKCVIKMTEKKLEQKVISSLISEYEHSWTYYLALEEYSDKL